MMFFTFAIKISLCMNEYLVKMQVYRFFPTIIKQLLTNITEIILTLSPELSLKLSLKLSPILSMKLSLKLFPKLPLKLSQKLSLKLSTKVVPQIVHKRLN